MWLNRDCTKTPKWQYGRNQFRKENLRPLLTWVSSKQQSLNGKVPRKTNERGRNCKKATHHTPSICRHGGSFISHFQSWVLVIPSLIDCLCFMRPWCNPLLWNTKIWLWVSSEGSPSQLNTPKHALLYTLAFSLFLLMPQPRGKHNFFSISSSS